MMHRLISEDFWKEYEISEDEVLIFDFRTIRIWCTKNKSELLVSHKTVESDNEIGTPDQEIPEDLDWNRFAVEKEKIEIHVLPIFPDRSVVVKPKLFFRLAKGSNAKIFIRVPIWIRIELVSKKPETIVELPTVTLSNTWFGSFLEGELCYWISSGARRTIETDPTRPYLAICPVQIIDATDEELIIEKLCLRVQNLSLFSDGQQLWTDQTKVFYKGKVTISQIEVARVAPKESPKAKLVSKPRKDLKKGITAMTFSTIKELPGLGFFTS